MTKKEFTELLSNVVEQKITELFSDLEDDLELKDNLRKRLIRQKKAVSLGERGEDLSLFAIDLKSDIVFLTYFKTSHQGTHKT